MKKYWTFCVIFQILYYVFQDDSLFLNKQDSRIQVKQNINKILLPAACAGFCVRSTSVQTRTALREGAWAACFCQQLALESAQMARSRRPAVYRGAALPRRLQGGRRQGRAGPPPAVQERAACGLPKITRARAWAGCTSATAAASSSPSTAARALWASGQI